MGASFEHGPSGYTNHHCRCPVCRAGNTDRIRQARARRRERRIPASVVHGASAYDNWACRCPVCRTDHAAVAAEWRARQA